MLVDATLCIDVDAALPAGIISIFLTYDVEATLKQPIMTLCVYWELCVCVCMCVCVRVCVCANKSVD